MLLVSLCPLLANGTKLRDGLSVKRGRFVSLICDTSAQRSLSGTPDELSLNSGSCNEATCTGIVSIIWIMNMPRELVLEVPCFMRFLEGFHRPLGMPAAAARQMKNNIATC